MGCLFDGECGCISNPKHRARTQAKSLAWKTGDREKNNVGQMWIMKVADSKKYLAAHNKFVKQTADIIGDRSMGFGKP